VLLLLLLLLPTTDQQQPGRGRLAASSAACNGSHLAGVARVGLAQHGVAVAGHHLAALEGGPHKVGELLLAGVLAQLRGSMGVAREGEKWGGLWVWEPLAARANHGAHRAQAGEAGGCALAWLRMRKEVSWQTDEAGRAAGAHWAQCFHRRQTKQGEQQGHGTLLTLLRTSKIHRRTSWLARPCRGPARPHSPAAKLR